MNSLSMTQTLFIVNAGSKTYTVTITEDIVDDGRDSYFIEAAKILIDKDTIQWKS